MNLSLTLKMILGVQVWGKAPPTGDGSRRCSLNMEGEGGLHGGAGLGSKRQAWGQERGLCTS